MEGLVHRMIATPSCYMSMAVPICTISPRDMTWQVVASHSRWLRKCLGDSIDLPKHLVFISPLIEVLLALASHEVESLDSAVFSSSWLDCSVFFVYLPCKSILV